MKIEEIAFIVKAKESIINNNLNIDEIIIDTRWIHSSEASMFVALIGKYRNGHSFIEGAYKKGIKTFLVMHHTEIEIYDDANYIFVDDTLQAVQTLAIYKRNQYHNEVIGITGSNGKTIIKEWLSTILSDSKEYGGNNTVCKNPKSYNSQIGVALSLWQLEERHTIGIFEGGISEVDEMVKIEKMIRPTIGILTNIGDAHLENFKDKNELALEKILLFKNSKKVVYREDDIYTKNAIKFLQEINPNIKCYGWSTIENNDSIFVKYNTDDDNNTIVTISFHNNNYSYTIPFTQKAFIENSIHTFITLLILDVNIEYIKSSIHQLNAIGMRLELRDAVHNSLLIADTYNSDVSSIKVALDYLAQQSGNKKIIIISDISASIETHKSIVNFIRKGIDQHSLESVITIGPIFLSLYQEGYFDKINNVDSFATTDDYLRYFHLNQFNNHTILLKGARKYEFEKIQQRLELQIHNTVMEINLESLTHNLNVYRSKISRGIKLMAMVKAFSYGHGGIEIAEKLQYEGVDYLAVAYTDEGIELRSEGIQLPIMVMSPDINAFDSMIRWRLEPEIFSVRSLEIFIEKTKNAQEYQYPIHIKLNTGMNRLGLEENDLNSIITLLNNTDNVKVASIFSHLAASDDDQYDDFTLLQKSKFEYAVKKLVDGINYKPLIHLANTSGIMHKSSLQYSMVRLGIGLYGINTSPDISLKLKPVATLKSYVVQLRNVAKGETVGYSRRGIISRDSVIATVAIGYADGYFRDFGNGVGYMMIQGKQAPIVGSVCMDMTMIDVTDIPNVSEGDEVIVFGPSLPVQVLADKARTIPYEILTGISQRVKRIFVEG